MRESRKERGRFSTLTASAFLRCVSRSAREYNSRPPRVATFMGGTAPLTPAPQPLPGARGAIALSHSTEHAMLPGPHIRGHSWSKTTPHARSLQHRSRARKPELQKFVPIRGHSWFKTTPHARSPQHRSRARKHELQKFVLIRVHSWFKTTPHARSLQHRTRARRPERQKFVLIRGHSWFKTTPHARSPQHRSRARKPELQKFVSIRGHSWFKTTRSEDLSGQISGWKARATGIRVHSWFKTTSTQGPRSTDLGLESPSYKNSCPFVSIRGSKQPAAKTFQGRSRAGKPELQEFVSIRGSKQQPRKVPAGQISGWKARATKIRAHSCPFVVQNNTLVKSPQHRSRAGKHELHEFVSIRGSKRPSSEISRNSSKSCQGFHSPGE